VAKLLAIRDDDTCFFTNPDELNVAFGSQISKGIKITLSVIPNTNGKFRYTNLSKHGTIKRRKFWENLELNNYLKNRIYKNEIDVVMHGFTHEYSKEAVPELKWKDAELARIQLIDAFNDFEKYLHKKIKTFVPPSNALSSEIAKVICSHGLNISGVIEKNFNRPINIYSMCNFIRKVSFKLTRGFTIPYVLNYGSHKELTFYNLTPSANINKLNRELAYCAKFNLPFVLTTHYWELLKNPKLLNELDLLTDKALSLGYEPVFLDDVFL
jgi:hypothetical protein